MSLPSCLRKRPLSHVPIQMLPRLSANTFAVYVASIPSGAPYGATAPLRQRLNPPEVMPIQRFCSSSRNSARIELSESPSRVLHPSNPSGDNLHKPARRVPIHKLPALSLTIVETASEIAALTVSSNSSPSVRVPEDFLAISSN